MDPSLLHFEMINFLESKGYFFDINDVGVLSQDLNVYCIIIVSLGGAWFSPYTLPEVDKIENYVLKGGCLLVLGENMVCPNSNINPLTERFGVTCGTSEKKICFLITNFSSHPVFSGVPGFYVDDVGYLDVSLPSIEMCWEGTPLSRCLIATAIPGEGKVIIIGDTNLFDNRLFWMRDARKMLSNIFNWFCPVSYPTPSPTACPTSTVTNSVESYSKSSLLILYMILSVLVLSFIRNPLRV